MLLFVIYNSVANGIDIYYGTCNDERVRLRSEPSLDSSIFGLLNKEDPFIIFSRSPEKSSIQNLSGYWLYIETEEQRGWIYSPFVSTIIPISDLPLYSSINLDTIDIINININGIKVSVSRTLKGDISFYELVAFYRDICGVYTSLENSYRDDIFHFKRKASYSWGEDYNPTFYFSADFEQDWKRQESLSMRETYEGMGLTTINKTDYGYLLNSNYEVPGVDPVVYFNVKIITYPNSVIQVKGYDFSDEKYKRLSGPLNYQEVYKEQRRTHQQIVQSQIDDYLIDDKSKNNLISAVNKVYKEIKSNQPRYEGKYSSVEVGELYQVLLSHDDTKIGQGRKAIQEAFGYSDSPYSIREPEEYYVNSFERCTPNEIENRFGKDCALVEVKHSDASWVLFVFRKKGRQYELLAVVMDVYLI